MEPMLAEFAQVAAEISYNRPKLRLISNVTGQPAMDGTLTQAAYWRDHVRQPVQFQAAMTWLHNNGYGLFLEVGPHPTLLGMGRRCLPDDAAGLWLPSLRRGRDDWQQLLLTSLADLFVYGVEIDWAGRGSAVWCAKITAAHVPISAPPLLDSRAARSGATAVFRSCAPGHPTALRAANAAV
jgi:acyl transferase domain-containing protein